ncbi:TauD/TfdA family dioxygenase [Mangrovimicrobium sediminis]|uniref:TauD/TfdA family dioxygenase n=1 Tax=Mangrovimicrobium sediminis TaxID=2562682 RepID=A0A4Z0M1S9_9GAMM|nr:TauD/TfdA family dioxygenase [Haliea sp. SAOS-164]TGD73318.1 TauD/TfdA family dioxygenase [Haliea sp. SAOS-164]
MEAHAISEKIRFERITPNLGAYAHVAPQDIVADGVPDRILEALTEYGVLVFPQLNLSDELMVELTGCMGDLEKPVATADGSDTANKGIYPISLAKSDKSQREYVIGNNWWHMDGTSYSVPGKATLLKCEQPPSAGGDTEFAHLFAAWEAMPEERKRELENLHVVHCLEAVGRKFKPDYDVEDQARWHKVFPPTEHPLVWHQKSGRTSLVIGSTAWGIRELPEDEGSKLLDELVEYCTQDEFTYRHHWHKGDLVIFNNPGLLHRSQPYDEASGRLMHRTTIKGSEAIA